MSADFRYGQNKKRGSNSFPDAVFAITGNTLSVPGTNSASRDEYNWAADFMVGRDIGLGGGPAQFKFGVRVAEIRSKTTGTAGWNVPNTTSATCINFLPTDFSKCPLRERSYVQTNRFLGAGPRLAIEGSAPIGGAWFVDYMGGIAGLYGKHSIVQTVTNIGEIGGVHCLAGCPVNFASSSDGFVFNADGMLGLGYAFTPTAKLSLNYRVDAYFDALRVVNATNGVSNVNRIYHGPNMRLTFQY